jgi:hypothetical protein
VTNETRARLLVRKDSLALDLAPLERRILDPADARRLKLAPLELLGYVNTRPVTQSRKQRDLFLFALCFYGGLAFLLWGVFVGTPWWYWAALGLLVAAAAFFRLNSEDEAPGVRFVQALYLFIVLVVGVGMPVAAVWAGGDMDTVWDSALNGTDLEQERATLTLLGRGIQTVFIVVVTLLPGLLFFLFNRYRLSTLEDEFTRQIFRLDRSVRTRGALHAKYGHLIDEAYGRSPQGVRLGRLQPGTRLPVIIATVIFALGWIVVLLNAEVDVVLVREGLRSLLAPWQSATAFAFLGAYVFLLQAALRAYLRGDLKPKFYSYAALRVVVVVVFAWVLDLMIPSDDTTGLLVTAFVIGMVPDTFLLRLREFVRDRKLGQLVEEHPLTRLEGIDIYDRTRLEQEGVTNVEALAHSNLAELMLQTRIPAGRLVDWVDQAQLYLHLPPVASAKENVERSEDDETDDSDRRCNEGDYRCALRARGIRTASDLIVAWRNGRNGCDTEALAAALGLERDGALVLHTVVDSIADEEWAVQILNWHVPHKEHTLRYPQDFDFANDVIPRP